MQSISKGRLLQLAIARRADMPRCVAYNGSRYVWVGHGWLNVGTPVGDEVSVESGPEPVFGTATKED